MDILFRIPEAWKAIIAGLAPPFQFAVAVLEDGAVSEDEAVTFAGLVVLAIAVFFKRNRPAPTTTR